jgi:TIR domain/SIR2-like domain
MVKIFISYSHHDSEYEASLRGHLSSAQKLEIRPISDTQLRPGDRWPEELEEYMEHSDAGVLLLSRAFFESKHCKAELERLIRREPPFRLLPILLEPCFWYEDKRLADIELVNPDRKSVIESSQPEKALFDIAVSIRKTLLETRERPSQRGVRRTEDKKDPWERIGKAIRDGLFTPVLGPGCYRLTEKTQEAKDHLRRRLNRLLEELQDQGDADAQEFAEGVAAAGLAEFRSYTASKAGPAMADWNEALIAFQAGLARLGAQCCSLLGSTMKEHPRGFIDVRSLFAHVIDDSALPPGSRLRDRFFAVTYLAAQLNKALEVSSRPSRGVGIRGIQAQLVILTYSIFYREIESDDCDDDTREWKRKHRELVAAAGRLLANRDREKSPRISLSDVEWLGDLLWHTMRFDAPMYPSPDELAFQLSVCLGTRILPRKERMGTIVEIADWQTRPELIRNFLRVYEAGASTRSEEETRFYDVLAGAFFVPQTGRGSSRGTPTGSGFQAATSQKIRVAISTNFDRELERAFDRLKQPYHLVLPVYVGDSDDGDAGAAEWAEGWLFLTVTWEESERITNEPPRLLEMDRAELAEMRIQGPVIVKLHGSPLERLPHRYMHRLSISDCDFIEAMISRDRFWPPGLRKLLDSKNRVLCFVGYPLSDTRSRLRLSDHLDGEQINRTLYLIDYPKDPLRHTLLEYIDVRLVLNELEELPGCLEACMSQGVDRYF